MDLRICSIRNTNTDACSHKHYVCALWSSACACMSALRLQLDTVLTTLHQMLPGRHATRGSVVITMTINVALLSH